MEAALSLLKTAKQVDRLAGLREQDPLVFYRPWSKQLEFHRNPAAIRAVLGGNRVGKTTMGVVEDLWIATGRHPFIKAPIPNRGRIGISDFKILDQVLWPKISSWLPAYEVAAYHKGYKGLVTKITFKNGSVIDMMSYEQPSMKWESVDLDWCHFDEPPPYEVFKATRARLVDRDGRMWFTLTPLEEPWIMDEVWEKCEDPDKPRYWGIMLDMRENPYLSRKAVGDFVAEVSSDDYEARVLGHFRHLTGRVFKDYTDEYPFVMTAEQAQISPSWPRMLVVDPHEKTPWALQWYARDEEHDTIYRIEDRRHDPADGIEVFGNLVRNVERLQSAPVPDHMRIIDTYAFKPTYNTGGNSLADEIREITGYAFRGADKSDQDSRLWDLIYRYKINPITHIPRIITLDRCVPARKEVKNYVWDKHRTKIGQYVEQKQTAVKKNDHALSCDHYMAAEWPSTARFADPISLFNDNPRAREEEQSDFPDFEGVPISIAEIHKIAKKSKRKGSFRRRSFY